MPLKICVIVGSLRRESINRRLSHGLTSLPVAAEFAFVHADIGTLPLYSQDQDPAPPPEVVALREMVKAADGVLFVSPEYNRSIPGVLKNAIDHGSRPHGKSVWAGKPAGVIGTSLGPIGTATMQQHLRNVLACLDMVVLGQPEAYVHWKDGLVAEDGTIAEASRDFLTGWMKKFLTLVEQHAGLPKAG